MQFLNGITKKIPYTLRIDMEDFEGQKRYAHYKKFSIADENNKYKLTVSDYSGDAG